MFPYCGTVNLPLYKARAILAEDNLKEFRLTTSKILIPNSP